VIALGDSFHDRDAHGRLSAPDRDAIAALQTRRDWIWISGNHDPALPSDLGGIVATEVAIGPIAFRHEPTGAAGAIRRAPAAPAAWHIISHGHYRRPPRVGGSSSEAGSRP